jgi:hypothetical protein
VTRRLLALVVLVVVVAVVFRWCRSAPDDESSDAGACVERAEQQVAVWRSEGKTEPEINRQFQVELAHCSGVQGACAAVAGAINVDFAWLGRQVLSHAITPVEYLARVRDREAKLRATRATPAMCDAYQRGDQDGDLVPDESDRCPNTPNLSPTGADGCPDTTPPPLAPSAAAVDDAAKALKIPLTQKCQDAAVPNRSSVLRLGLNPLDDDSFLVEVSGVTNQPAGCPVFYEVEIRLTNSSFFSGSQSQNSVRRVFRPADALQTPTATAGAIVFQFRPGPSVPWNELVDAGIEPSDHAIKNLRVRAVNGSGTSAGWSSFRTREFRLFNRNFQ